MLDTERRQRLVELVDQRHSLTVAELSAELSVSPATIRRDLAQLSQQGMIERAHGGAARRIRRAVEMPEPPLLRRSSLQVEEKRRIGKAAAAYVCDGETIIISSGTTTAEMVPHLAGCNELTVITNALNIVLGLAAYPNITVIVLGGVLRHSELTVLGALAEDAMEQLRAHKLFMGSPAIHLDYGLSAGNFAESRSDQTLMKASREVIVVADHTKFGRVDTVHMADFGRIQRVITDRGVPDEDVTAMKSRSVLVDVV